MDLVAAEQMAETMAAMAAQIAVAVAACMAVLAQALPVTVRFREQEQEAW
jgi:hypothetical protein